MNDDPIRIQKWLAKLGLASRREAERWIDEGRIAVNGERVTEQGRKIVPSEDQVTLNGKLVVHKVPPRVYWLLHKPDEILTSRPKPDDDRATIYDLPKIAKLQFMVAPVGRLDYRTEGLLLLTNDGELAHRLTHPSHKIPRMYYALISERLEKSQEQQIRKGITLEDGPVKGCEIKHQVGKNMGASKGSWYTVTVYEGRNRLVRRIFEHFDRRVVRLVRYGMGDLRLPDALAPGDYRQLKPTEIAALKKATGLA